MKKILCIHGVGNKEASFEKWSLDWTHSIQSNCGFSEKPEVEFLFFDKLFEDNRKEMGIQYGKAIFDFVRSWISTSISEREKSKGLFDKIAWSAGMPAQFSTQEELRIKLQVLLAEKIAEFKPDVIFAHSLGTLICYDYFRQEKVKKIQHSIVLITAGSQIMHPALRMLFGGAILPLNIQYWYNLCNTKDNVFASIPIQVSADNFSPELTEFNDFPMNHDALEYLNHPVTINNVWPEIKSILENKGLTRAIAGSGLSRSFKPIAAQRKPKRKAVLIGINDYPDQASKLEGCVNDVFRMSEVLQEYGFLPEEIRVALDNRATANDIRERLDWLLHDARPGDLRFFFYSGHGAQIPSSHSDYEEDCSDECLVPYDFDWSLERAFTDKEFLQLYAQLSLEVDFVSVFDCCHSGGMTRGNGARPKGLTPPDDIRHRELRWNEKNGMWIPRDLDLNLKLFKNKSEDEVLYTGTNGKTNRLGRAIPLWNNVKDFEKAKKTYGTVGPFMPVILQACSEQESAYEYRHGVTSYGAFTFSLTNILRKKRASGEKLNFDILVKESKKLLKALEYDQTPVVVGPKIRTKANIPFPIIK